MAQYQLNPSTWKSGTIAATVGRIYNIALADTTASMSDGTTGAYYGYLLHNDLKDSPGLIEKTDIATRDALVNYGSPNLVDRDLVFYPRVTQGDTSGGGTQQVWINPTKYFDSDLDPRVPGYLRLREQWTRVQKTGLTVGSSFQCVSFNGDFWFTFNEGNGNIYSANGGTSTSPTASNVLSICTDGKYLYAGLSGSLYRWDATTWTQVASALNTTAGQWWVINQGTNGYFAYYSTTLSTVPARLYKIDLTASFPVAAANQAQVPTGSNSVAIIDLCAYQNGIAILTNDGSLVSNAGPGLTVWYHDGTNMTQIVRLEGYVGQGICNVLGDLYVGAQAVGKVNSPILIAVGSGSYRVVAKPGSPFPTANQTCLGPVGGNQFVYWPILNPSLSGISSGKGVIVQYDTLTGAVSHLPNQDATDFTTAGSTLRSVAVLGDSVACCYVNGTTGVLQYQQSVFGTIKYQSSGWLATSNLDFATPGIPKRFRRIEVHHSALAAGEAITVEAFVDIDPLTFTTSLTPVPSGATATNSTAGSTVTVMTFGQDTVGRALFAAVKLTAGTNQATTPKVFWIAVEVGGTWTWELNLDCSFKRVTLAGQPDDQGVTGKDLHFLLRNAYENGSTLTLYLAQSVSYTVAIERVEGRSSPYKEHIDENVKADQEWLTKLVLRQIA